MARQKKSRKKPKQAPLSTEALALKAQSELDNNRYKDAVAAYNQLVKIERKPEWVSALADAYHARAIELTNKGMLKEAIVIWENRSKTCQCVPANPRYIMTLFRLGKTTQALSLTQQHWTSLAQADDASMLESHIAALLLTSHKKQLADFPTDSLLAKHLPAAEQLLHAYQQGEQDLEPLFKQISFRSPYRDLRSAIKALSLVVEAPHTALSLVSKIPPTSAFARFTPIIHAAAQEGEAFLQAFMPLDNAQQHAVMNLKGWTDQHRTLCQTLSTLDMSPTAVFTFCIQHQDFLGKTTAQALCQMLLAFPFRGYDQYSRAFGALPEHQILRFKALRAEQGGDSNPCEIWAACAGKLRLHDPQKHTDASAAIFRHAAKKTSNVLDQIEYSLKSLEYAPEDQATYLKITDLYRQTGNAKQFRLWADKTVKRYPDEPRALTLIVQSATENSTYKKAAKYAKHLLEIDPINRKVRDLLTTSHLQHAAKLADTGKLNLARKELAQATEWDKHGHQTTRIGIAYGLLAWLNNDQPAAIQYLNTARKVAGDCLCRLHLWLDASTLGLNPLTIIKQTQWGPVSKHLKADDVTQLIREINQQPDTHKLSVRAAMKIFTPALKHAAQQALSEPDLCLICSCLADIASYELLTCYAKTGVKQHPEHAIFGYYQIVGETQGMSHHLTIKQHHRLDDLLALAEDNDDQKTLHLIRTYLPMSFGHSRPPAGLFGFDDDDDDDDDDDFFEDTDELGIFELMQSPELIAFLPKAEKTLRHIADDPEFEAFQRRYTPKETLMGILALLSHGMSHKAITLKNIDSFLSEKDILDVESL